MLVLWLCAMLVLLKGVMEKDKDFPVHHSTLSEITMI